MKDEIFNVSVRWQTRSVRWDGRNGGSEQWDRSFENLFHVCLSNRNTTIKFAHKLSERIKLLTRMINHKFITRLFLTVGFWSYRVHLIGYLLKVNRPSVSSVLLIASYETSSLSQGLYPFHLDIFHFLNI